VLQIFVYPKLDHLKNSENKKKYIRTVLKIPKNYEKSEKSRGSMHHLSALHHLGASPHRVTSTLPRTTFIRFVVWSGVRLKETHLLLEAGKHIKKLQLSGSLDKAHGTSRGFKCQAALKRRTAHQETSRNIRISTKVEIPRNIKNSNKSWDFKKRNFKKYQNLNKS
jgi:hypothetical protein